MKYKSKFVIMDHFAIKAGKHQDLRFKLKTGGWASFAVPRGVPINSDTKVMAIRTANHSEKDALFVGKIPEGEYGGGVLKEFDSGDCEILKFEKKHIVIDFKGKKVKGIYHLIDINRITSDKRKQKQYMLFKSKSKINTEN